MELTNYWMLLIWLVAGGFVLSKIIPQQQVLVAGKIEYRWTILASVILTVPYIIWAGFRSEWIGDTYAYKQMFLSVPSDFSSIGTYLAEHSKDRGFSVLMTVFKLFIGNSYRTFFVIVAAFQMLCVALVFRKYSANFLMSFFLFVVSTDYMSWTFNGIRQFIVVAAIFACFGLLVKKKYVPLICVILLCSTIHASALIMLPIIFIVQGKAWNKKTIFFILAVGIAILFMERFTSILDSLLAETQYNDILSNEIWLNDDGTNILRVAVYSVPAVLSLIGKKHIDEANNPVINICVNASACTMIIYLLSAFSSGIYVGRLPIYTTLMGYIAMPWLIDRIFTKQSATLVKVIMVVLYLTFFYYQMFVVW